ncbi:hypothetical protein CTAYLR_005286 [Chrysophaeum taylorii]|uniref:J domain-containing protein n=1 Tax=Chrysophaeum taylorii TaxID=2483200 RepID=A0AAD7UJ55_9STRA|nr:hypothetical protein CTAYLR_005286 [Chrysophaeum taylorii]
MEAGECVVTSEALELARGLSRERKHVEAAAVLMRARCSYDSSVETSRRDGAKLLESSLRALSMDSHACLGVHSHASTVEIRRAYRALALSYHPDKNAGATGDLFAAITAAYNELLSKADAAERRRSNEGAQPQTPPPPRAPPQTPPSRPTSDGGADPDEEWERMFWEMTKYKLDHGHCYATPTKNGDLGTWAATQRVANESGQLSTARRSRLEAIGFNIDDVDWRKRIINNAKPSSARPRRKKKSTTPKKGVGPTPVPSRSASAPSRSTSSRFFCSNLEEPDDTQQNGEATSKDASCDDEPSGPPSTARSTDSWSFEWFGDASRAAAPAPRRNELEANTFEISVFGITLVRIESVTTTARPAPSRRSLRRKTTSSSRKAAATPAATPAADSSET